MLSCINHQNQASKSDIFPRLSNFSFKNCAIRTAAKPSRTEEQTLETNFLLSSTILWKKCNLLDKYHNKQCHRFMCAIQYYAKYCKNYTMSFNFFWGGIFFYILNLRNLAKWTLSVDWQITNDHLTSVDHNWFCFKVTLITFLVLQL